MQDTLKTSFIGYGTFQLGLWDVLPEVVNVGVGVITFFYIAVKLWLALKELQKLRTTKGLYDYQG